MAKKKVNPKRQSLLKSLLGWGAARKAGIALSSSKSRIDRAVNSAVSGKKRKSKKTKQSINPILE